MDEIKEDSLHGLSARWDLVALSVILAGLGSIIVLSLSGIMGYMQSLEEGNVFSVAVIAGLIAAIFIFLHRLGVSLVFVEEIGPQKA